MSVKIHLYDACLTKDVRVFTKMVPKIKNYKSALMQNWN